MISIATFLVVLIALAMAILVIIGGFSDQIVRALSKKYREEIQAEFDALAMQMQDNFEHQLKEAKKEAEKWKRYAKALKNENEALKGGTYNG